MQVQTIFCNQIQYCVFRTSVRARILKFLSKPSPTPIYYPQVFASALSCNSSGTAIAFLPASRAHPLARWHRFVSIERPEPLQTALQGTSARAMVCRKITDLPRTALRARLVPSPHFPAIHLARQSPFYGPAGHIDLRDGIDLCPSSAANPSRHRSKAHSLAR